MSVLEFTLNRPRAKKHIQKYLNVTESYSPMMYESQFILTILPKMEKM